MVDRQTATSTTKLTLFYSILLTSLGAELASVIGIHIDASSSQKLQESLNMFSRQCNDDLKMQAITCLLNKPMQPAVYFAGGSVDEADWCHFALHIPYYTHFTSPIRRYADLMVHRLLQASLEQKRGAFKFHQDEAEVQAIAERCNECTMASKKAQERSDVIFLSIYLKSHPVKSALGVVVSMGAKSFTVLVPSLGLETKINLDDQAKIFNFYF